MDQTRASFRRTGVSSGRPNKGPLRYRPGTTSMPLSFGWHLVAEVADAFLELHFGLINDKYNDTTASEYYHGDLHGANLMFRYPGAYKDYPDFVIADLGTTKHLAAGSDDEEAIEFYKQQTRDAGDLGCAIYSLIRPVGDSNLSAALALLSDFKSNDSDVDDGNERWSNMLSNVRGEALEKRKALYKPLPPALARNPLPDFVSDEDLSNVYTDLQ